jgi:hypothetical protein
MNTHELIEAFVANHAGSSEFICALTDEQFVHSHNGKWTAGQQLSHLLLCLQPISRALASKEYIQEKFGTQQRAAMSYEEVLAATRMHLQNGAKAPERFLPAAVAVADRAALAQELSDITATIKSQLQSYSEDELDRLVMPHPFLGMLSVREMFYLMSYHPLHHLQQVRAHLGMM